MIQKWIARASAKNSRDKFQRRKRKTEFQKWKWKRKSERKFQKWKSKRKKGNSKNGKGKGK